jgi:nucleoside-diphosphate-sugar epimerase
MLSPSKVTECFVAAHEIAGEKLGFNRVLALPGLTATVTEMIAALERVAGREVAERVRVEPDPRVQRIVDTWPVAVDASRAVSLGFPSDQSFEDIVRRYVAEDLPRRQQA